MRRPSVIFLLALASGIFYRQWGLKTLWLVGPFCCYALLCHPKRKTLILGFVAFFLGLAMTGLKSQDLKLEKPWEDHEMIQLQGTLIKKEILEKDKAFFLFKEPSTGREKKLYVVFPYGKDPVDWISGQGVTLTGSFEVGDFPRNPGTFNEGLWLKTKGAIGKLKIKTLEFNKTYDRPLEQFKDKVGLKLAHSIIQNTAFGKGPVAAGMLYGEDSWIDDATLANYAVSGTKHILSISGAHFGIMLLWVHKLLEGRSWRYWHKKALVWGILGTFLWLIGWDIAAVRAYGMFLCLEGLRAGFKQADGLNSLALAISTILLINPFSLFDIGLQLAVLAMYGLLVFAPLVNELWPKFKRPHADEVIFLKDYIVQRLIQLGMVMVQSLVVCFCLLPILRNQFNQFTWLSILYNIPVAILSGLFLPLGILQALFCFYEPAVRVIGIISGGILYIMDKIVASSSAIYMLKPLPSFSEGLTLLYFFLLMLPLLFKQSQWRLFEAGEGSTEEARQKGMVCLMVLLLLIGTSVFNYKGGSGELEAYFFDVGQGDGTLVIAPTGETLLVDTGLDKGNLQVSDSLFKLGIHHIDYLLLSHPHSDHMGGASRILKEHPVGTFLYFKGLYNAEETSALNTLIEEAKASKTEVINIEKGDSIELGKEVLLKVLYPEKGFDTEDTNDESLVVEVLYKSTGILFTGDITKKVECDIIDQIDSVPMVLKAPHHGSAGSNSFELLSLENLYLATISAGERNLYGHPKPETLERYDARQIPVFRTDLLGAVHLKSDGNTFYLKSQFDKGR